MITTGNDALMEERQFIMGMLTDYEDLEITDTGLGMGQADLVYERDAGDDGERRRVSITIGLEES